MSLLKAEVQAFWEGFLASQGLQSSAVPSPLVSFPGSKAIADELVGLYLAGKKTAASGLLRDYEVTGDPVPEVGNYWVILDSQERPRCIAKTIRVQFSPFKDIPEEVAIAEAEGDLSVRYWKEAHGVFFTPFLSQWGVPNLEEAIVVTEFFEVFLPPFSFPARV